MDSDKARSTVWPFNRNRGLSGRRIGDLLDEGLIGDADLRWAADFARSQSIRAACEALLGESEAPATVAVVEPEPTAPRVTWQDLIPPDFAGAWSAAAQPTATPLPTACPICGGRVIAHHAWDTPRRLGWRCEVGGFACYFANRAKAIRGWFFREHIVPPSDDGSYPGVCRGEIATADTHPCGYWPPANR